MVRAVPGWVRVGAWIFVLLTALFLLAPLIVVMGVSVSEGQFIVFPPKGFSLRWYEKALTVSGLRRCLLAVLEARGPGDRLGLHCWRGGGDRAVAAPAFGRRARNLLPFAARPALDHLRHRPADAVERDLRPDLLLCALAGPHRRRAALCDPHHARRAGRTRSPPRGGRANHGGDPPAAAVVRHAAAMSPRASGRGLLRVQHLVRRGGRCRFSCALPTSSPCRCRSTASSSSLPILPWRPSRRS